MRQDDTKVRQDETGWTRMAPTSSTNDAEVTFFWKLCGCFTCGVLPCCFLLEERSGLKHVAICHTVTLHVDMRICWRHTGIK